MKFVIILQGISRMNRDHIHFAPAEHGAMSGMYFKMTEKCSQE